MRPGDVTGVLAWLDTPEARALDPRVASAVRRTLQRDDAATFVTTAPAGTTTVFVVVQGSRRRVLELDRSGTLLASLRWGDDDGLGDAALRIPDGSWVLVEPAASAAEGARRPAGPAAEAPWGPSDRVWHAHRPDLADAEFLTVFTGLDWTRVGEIPTMAEPARLPSGAGSTLLNLIASLAIDQGHGALVYRGPFASEQLFLALLESFRYPASIDDPLGRFIAGDLEWLPAPHERAFEPEGVSVQIRGRVEKVVWQARTYYRRDWQSVARHAPRRITEDSDGRVRCGLWALGEPLEHHLELDRDGHLLAVLDPSPPPPSVHGLDPVVARGLARTVAASSAPALAPAIETIGERLSLEWGPVDHDLLAVDGDRLRLSSRLREAAARRLRSVDDPRARLAVTFAVMSEAAALIGDPLRARAQAALLALPPDEQARVLAAASEKASGAVVDLEPAARALLGDLAQS